MRSLERVLGIGVLGVVTVATGQQLTQFYMNGAAANAGYAIPLWSGFNFSLFGAAAASGVLFEALLYPVGRYCFKNRNYAGAFISFLMLAACLLYTGVLDYESNVVGRLDKSAERNAVVDNRASAKAELEQLAVERKVWLARIESPHVTRKEVSELTAQLTATNDRAERLRQIVANMAANAGGQAASAQLSANTGYSEAALTLTIILTKLLYPMLVRAFGLAIAIYAFEMASAPVEEVKKEIGLRPTAVEPEVIADARKKVLAEEKKVYPAIEAMKANALALKGNAIDAAVAAVRAKRGDDALPLNEIMGELAAVHEARGLPQPSVGHSKAVGKRMEKLGFETVGRHQAYKEKKRGSHKHKATASA